MKEKTPLLQTTSHSDGKPISSCYSYKSILPLLALTVILFIYNSTAGFMNSYCNDMSTHYSALVYSAGRRPGQAQVITYRLPQAGENETNAEPNRVCEPENLVGSMDIDFDMEKLNLRMHSMKERYGKYFARGEYAPDNCEVQKYNHVAILIPFRDASSSHIRVRQFEYFLYYMVPVLMRQKIHFRVYLINQSNDGAPFNRAKLLNIGFNEARKDGFDCFFFHDVDLVAENDKNLYRCVPNPQHYSGWIDKFNYKLPYNAIFGGITAFTTEAFEKINGYSNEYWGWGGEDDDLERRTIMGARFKLLRPSEKVARYKMIKHPTESSNKPNPDKKNLLNHWNRHNRIDGLNSLIYDVLDRREETFFVNVTVNVLYESRMPLKTLLAG